CFFCAPPPLRFHFRAASTARRLHPVSLFPLEAGIMTHQVETAQVGSVWAATVKRPEFAALKENLHADVCIVGAGIAGLSTAYMLAHSGKKVVVLDDGDIGGGMTEVTTAHLTNAIDDRYYQLERLHGAQGARFAAESHTAAINRIEAIAKLENIDCDFERLDGYLFLSPEEKEDILHRELAAAHRVGLRDVMQVARAPLES